MFFWFVWFVVLHACENMDVELITVSVLTHHLLVWQLLQMRSERAWGPKAWTRWSVNRFCPLPHFTLLQEIHASLKQMLFLCLFQIQDEKGDVTITNDGATILKQMQVLHPAAKMVRSNRRSLDAPLFRTSSSLILLFTWYLQVF